MPVFAAIAIRGAVAAIATTVGIAERCSLEWRLVAVDLPADTGQVNVRKMPPGFRTRSMAASVSTSIGQLDEACSHPPWALFDGRGLLWGRPWA